MNAATQAGTGRLQRRLRHPVRMSVGLSVELAEQIAALSSRVGRAPDSVVRGLVKEALRARGVQL